MKYFVAAILLLFCFEIYGVFQETASLKEFFYGTTEQCEYDNWVSHVSEGIVSDNYNLYAPYDRQLDGFGSFNIASTGELDTWGTAIEYFLDGDLDNAELYLDLNNFPFQLVEFYDTDTERTYYMIRESLNMTYYDNNNTADTGDDEVGGFDYGWGVYIYNPDASNPIIMTVVHPCDDYIAAPLAVECFQEWDAMFLQINGAGREVVWTEVGNYNNSKSLSDPSRNTNHAFTQAYYLFCEKIREVFSRREFSPQVHSYDWSRHAGYANCQLSAGYNESCPNLPIRDMSDLKLDLINASSHLIHEAETIGANEAVYLNDFYAVHYNEYEFIFADEDTSYTVNNDVDLVGYSQNRQMLYSFNNWNSYDVYEPFFHLEMDELPNCYSQVSANLRWFYGYNTDTGLYEMDNIFDNTLLYYRPYVDAITEILPAMFEFDDGDTPAMPEDLIASFMGYDEIEVSWDPVSSYDFKTYEIYYSIDHITEENYTNYDRYDSSIMASPDQSFITIPDLEENQQYYFIIRAIDYNDNYSAFSPEVYAITAPADFAELKVIGEDSESVLSWELEVQDGVLGYRIYRKTIETSFTMLDDYHNNLELLGGNDLGTSYTYADTTAENGVFYTYKISSINHAAYEYIYDEEIECSPRQIYFLEIYDEQDTLLDSVAFSSNPYASDDYDEDYDIIKPESEYNGILSAAFYESNWNEEGIYLSREILGIYDPTDIYETWTMKLRSHLVDQPLTLKVSDNYERNVEKLYLYSYSTGEISNIADVDLEFTVSDTNYNTFTLIWGDLLPNVYFTYQPNRIYQEGDELLIDWNINYPVLVDHVDLFVSNYDDSLNIATNIESSQTEFNWTVPADFTMHNARFGLDIYTVHDEVFLRTSPFIVGFLPLEQILLPEPGWQMITNPWKENPVVISEDFIYRNELYKVDETFNYSLTDSMFFGEGYWLNTLTPSEYIDDSLIEKETYWQSLFPGWNLLSNPHLCSYDIEDLKIEIDGDDFTFNQAVRDEFISRAIYSYRTEDTGPALSGDYQLISEIQPNESFWLYCYADMLLDPFCMFIPYYNSYYSFPDLETQVKLEFTQELGDTDELVLGLSSNGEDEFEYEYDLPEPPVKPIPDAISVYLIKDAISDTTFPHEKLNWEYRPLLSNSDPEEVVWQVRLEVNTPGPVTISAEFLEVLPTYEIVLQIGAFQAEISESEPATFTALNPGLFLGTITISNGLDFNNSVSQVQDFSSFPNPFNPETTFNFNLKEDARVELEVFNIKGQKVRTLQEGFLTQGSHSFIWRGKNNYGESVSSGVYFVRFQNGSKEYISKLLLLK